MFNYKEFQFGWILFVIIIPIHLILTVAYIKQIGDRPLDTNGYILASSIFLIVVLLFYGMNTQIKGDRITISYGIGLIRKNIAISRIKSIQTISTNPVYYGWGIRIIPNGMLYNISGTKGIELGFIDTNRIIRIGTKRPEILKDTIFAAIKK